MKHTEGNWRYSANYSEITTSRIGILEGSKKICSISDFDKKTEEVKANAKLIATAPEMLEVLETIENDANQVPEWLWNRIKSVIKKATE